MSRVAALALIACSAAIARAEHRDRELSFSIGYAQLSIDAAVLDDLDGEGGVRFEPRFSWPPFDNEPRFRLGIGLGFSFFYDEQHSGEEFGGFADIENFQNLGLFIPELQATWRQYVRANWYVEGGVGVGAVFADLRAGQVVFDELFDEDFSEWDFGFGLRPLVRGAFEKDYWSVGLEGSYLFTDLDFGGGLSGDVEELYIGFFFTHKF